MAERYFTAISISDCHHLRGCKSTLGSLQTSIIACNDNKLGQLAHHKIHFHASCFSIFYRGGGLTCPRAASAQLPTCLGTCPLILSHHRILIAPLQRVHHIFRDVLPARSSDSCHQDFDPQYAFTSLNRYHISPRKPLGHSTEFGHGSPARIAPTAACSTRFGFTSP